MMLYVMPAHLVYNRFKETVFEAEDVLEGFVWMLNDSIQCFYAIAGVAVSCRNGSGPASICLKSDVFRVTIRRQ